MKEDRFVLIIIFVVLIVGGFLFYLDKDSVKFKREYESLNDTIREEDGARYNNVSIDSNNPIKYIDSEEALSILDSDKAIIYVGANWCPWCRNAVPVLFDVAKDYNVKKIYYLNLDEEKSDYEIKNEKLVQTNKGTEGYYKLLNKLEDHLQDYVLTDEIGGQYNTGEKRIFMPTVITVKDGKVISTYTGTVTLDENQTKYSKMTESQKEILYNIYDQMFKQVYDK